MRNTVPAWITAISTLTIALILIAGVIIGMRTLQAFSDSMNQATASADCTAPSGAEYPPDPDTYDC
jgi:hypothetical protein